MANNLVTNDTKCILRGEVKPHRMGPKICQELVNEVCKKDLCILCGAFIGWCPYFIP
jgi:hypothetical protein